MLCLGPDAFRFPLASRACPDGFSPLESRLKRKELLSVAMIELGFYSKSEEVLCSTRALISGPPDEGEGGQG